LSAIFLTLAVFSVSINPHVNAFAKVSPFANKKIERIDTIEFRKNKVVTYQSIDNQWYKVEYNNRTGNQSYDRLSDKFAKTYPYKLQLDAIIDDWQDVELSKENIIKLAVRLEIDRIDIFFQQMIIESGNLTSSVCRKNHNVKGMRKASQRFTYAIGTKGGYAVYKSWAHSVADYKLWQLQNPWDPDKETYGKYLDRRGYAASNTYGRRMEKVSINTFKPYLALYIDETRKFVIERFGIFYALRFYANPKIYGPLIFDYTTAYKPFYYTS